MTEKNSTRLGHLRRARGLTIPTLAGQIRFPAKSIALLESGQYPLCRIREAPESANDIERRLQCALETDLSLTDLLG